MEPTVPGQPTATSTPTPEPGVVPPPTGPEIPPPPPSAEAAPSAIPSIQPTPAEDLPSAVPPITIGSTSETSAPAETSTATETHETQRDALADAFEVIFEPMTITEMTTFVNDYMTRTRANGGQKAEEDLERVANAYAETIKKKMGITDPTPVH